MANYLSSFLTTTTTKYQSIRRALISSDADGDTEDESHISRALRNYYTEKGRPFPDWLPPDPNAPPPPQPAAAYNAPMNNQQMQQGQGQGRWGRGGGGLSDLWDNQGGQQQMPPPNDSLRQPRFGQQPQQAPMASGRGSGRFGDVFGDQGSRTQAAGRASDYEQQGGRMQESNGPSPAPSAGSGITPKDMLKQKLWGTGRAASPASSAGSGAYAPPARDSGLSYGGSDRFEAPSARPSYGGGSPYGGNDTYGNGGRQQSNSGSSWGADDGRSSAGSARGYGGGPYSNTGQAPSRGTPQAGRMGLPSGPRPRRT